MSLFLAYILMLILMTFNFWLFLSICFGYMTGYAIFGFQPVEFSVGSKVKGYDSTPVYDAAPLN